MIDFLSLARAGLRMPIGADLVLYEQPNPEAIRLDGAALGRVVEAAARRYHTPLAFPLMDLRLEKLDLLAGLGVAEHEADAWQFSSLPPAEPPDPARPFPAPCRAHFDAIAYIARNTDLVPIGMAIGPFSLMTKLLADPITPVAMAGGGLAAQDDPSIAAVERALALAEATLHRSLRAQLDSGARAVLICEPAANRVFLSPRQLGSGIFDRYVLQPALRFKQLITDRGAQLVFHDCGELTPEMVRRFGHEIRPSVLSLGSSRKLWEDAALIPPDVVLYGNLPTKTFYSDTAMPDARVLELTAELLEKMRATGHPHILGSECDVLHVPDSAATIRHKVELMLSV